MSDGEAADPAANRLILRGSASAVAGLLIRLGARLLFLFIAARLFGAVLFGAYSLAVAIVELAVAAGLLGMKRILFKLLDEDESGRPPAHILLDAAVVVGAISSALALGLMALLLLPPIRAAAGETGFALFLIAPMIAGQALLDLFLAATRWKHRMRYEVVARSIVEPWAALAATAVAWLAGFTETGLVIGYSAGTLLALAYALLGARRAYGGFGFRRYRLPRGRPGEIVAAGGIPMGTDLVAALFARLDLYLVGLFLGEGPAGIYGVARQIRTPIRQLRQSFDGLLTPIAAKTLAARGTAETGAAFATAARLILALQLPLLIAMIVIGLPLLNWFGPEFAAGYWALVYLAAAETVLGAFGVSELILLYRAPRRALAITVFMILVNLALGWALIAHFGIDGAAAAVLVAVSAGAIVRRHALRGLGVRVPLLFSLGPVAAAAAGIAAGLFALRALPGAEIGFLLAALAAAIGVYASVLKLWLAMTGETLALRRFRTG